MFMSLFLLSIMCLCSTKFSFSFLCFYKMYLGLISTDWMNVLCKSKNIFIWKNKSCLVGGLKIYTTNKLFGFFKTIKNYPTWPNQMMDYNENHEKTQYLSLACLFHHCFSKYEPIDQHSSQYNNKKQYCWLKMRFKPFNKLLTCFKIYTQHIFNTFTFYSSNLLEKTKSMLELQ
jgi:hypothetical protein